MKTPCRLWRIIILLTLLMQTAAGSAQEGLPPLPDDLDLGDVLFPGITYTGTVVDEQGSRYVLLAEAGDQLVVRMTRRSGNLVPYVELIEASGTLIAETAANDLAGKTATLRHTLEAQGWYYIRARNDPAAGLVRTGTYELVLVGPTETIYSILRPGSTPPDSGALSYFLTLTPSATPTIPPTKTSTPTPRPTNTATRIPSPVPATATPNDVIGYANVNTLYSATLNLRDQAKVDAQIIEELPFGTSVEIIGGPVRQDGFTWWNVRSPSGNTGWSVESADNVQTLVFSPRALGDTNPLARNMPPPGFHNGQWVTIASNVLVRSRPSVTNGKTEVVLSRQQTGTVVGMPAPNYDAFGKLRWWHLIRFDDEAITTGWVIETALSN